MSIKLFQAKTRAPAGGELQRRDKLRWSLRQRLCEQIRHLAADCFDEVDDFLFAAGQQGQFSEEGSCLQAMREIRSKRDQFEESFLNAVSASLLRDWRDLDSGEITVVPGKKDAGLENIEVELALKGMRRKALKFYAPHLKQLQQISSESAPENGFQVPGEWLVNNVIFAVEASHAVFNLPMEIKLIFLKLIEQHVLLKMDKLFLDTISILNNVNDEVFVERLYAAAQGLPRSKVENPPVASAASPVVAPAKPAQAIAKSKKPLRAPEQEAAISDVGKSIISADDLNELVSLLSGDKQNEPKAQVAAGKDDMTHYLALADSLVDGTELIYIRDRAEHVCLLQKSQSVENSYALRNRQGKLVLTRSRIGLAISLRSGELRVADGIDTQSGASATVFSPAPGSSFGFTIQ